MLAAAGRSSFIQPWVSSPGHALEPDRCPPAPWPPVTGTPASPPVPLLAQPPPAGPPPALQPASPPAGAPGPPGGGALPGGGPPWPAPGHPEGPPRPP